MQALLRPNTNSTHKWNGTLQHYKDASEIPNISKQPVLLSNAHQTHPTPYVPTRQGQRRQCMHGVLRPPASIGRFDGRVFESWVPSIERLHGLTMRMQVSGGRVGGLFLIGWWRWVGIFSWHSSLSSLELEIVRVGATHVHAFPAVCWVTSNNDIGTRQTSGTSGST